MDKYIPENYEADVKALTERVTAFLAEPDQGDGASWPTLSLNQVQEARDLLYDMLELKWGRDCDGDVPFKLSLLYRRAHFLPWDIPLEHGDDQESSAQEKLRLMQNISRISGAMDTYAKQLDICLRGIQEITRQEQCDANEFPVYVVAYQDTEATWKEAFPYDKPCSIHLTAEAAEAFQPPAGFIKQKTREMDANPSAEPWFNLTDTVLANYREKVAQHCEKIVPRFNTLQKLGIRP